MAWEILEEDNGNVPGWNWCEALKDTIKAISKALNAEAVYVFIHECFRPLCSFFIGQGEPQWDMASKVALKALEREELFLLDSPPQGSPSTGSWLGIPLMEGDKAMGVINLVLPPNPPLTSRELHLLKAMGNQLITSLLAPRMCKEAHLDKGRFYTQIKQLIQQLKTGAKSPSEGEERPTHEYEIKQLYGPCAIVLRMQERERERIAQDLHDSVTQLLVGALYETQAAKEYISSNVAAAQKSLDKVQTLLHQAETEMRHIIYDLHSSILESKGLISAIKEYACALTELSNIRCSIKVEGTPYRLSPEVEMAIYRIVQEALRNVRAHSQATQATITFTFRRSGLEVVIADNGKGFDYQAFLRNPAGHLGIRGMKERAHRMGSKLEVVSQIGKGTKVILKVPAMREEKGDGENKGFGS